MEPKPLRNRSSGTQSLKTAVLPLTIVSKLNVEKDPCTVEQTGGCIIIQKPKYRVDHDITKELPEQEFPETTFPPNLPTPNINEDDVTQEQIDFRIGNITNKVIQTSKTKEENDLWDI